MRSVADASLGKLSLAAAARIDEICTRFDAEYGAGHRPDVEEYLAELLAAERNALQHELIRLDIYYRKRNGQTVCVEDYRRRFEGVEPAWLEAQIALTTVKQTPNAPNTPLSSESTTRIDPPSRGPARYRPLHFHAAGGLGEVFVARDDELGRTVALKRLHRHWSDNPNGQRRLVEEAEITGRLEHPGIVPVYGLEHDEHGHPCYAMRFIEGETLEETIQRFHSNDCDRRDENRRRLELRQLLGRFITVCNAVAYAHSMGVVHRDIKPSNIMLGHFGETLVMDWGLARTYAISNQNDMEKPEDAAMSGTQTPAGKIVGTPAFMSPEQAAGDTDEITSASDVYSLGATLYMLLTGRPPFSGQSIAEVLDHARRVEFVPPRRVDPDIPAALEAVCLKAMARRAEHRYESALALSADLEHWLADERVLADHESFSRRLARGIRRHPGRAGAFAASLLVTLGALAAIVVLQERSRLRLHDEQARTEIQRQNAETSYRLARESRDNFSSLVEKDPRFRRGPLEDFRRKAQLQDREFFEKFLAIRADDPEYQLDRAKVFVRLGLICHELGSADVALSHLVNAREIFEQPQPTNAVHFDWQIERILTLRNLGNAYSDLGRYSEAESTFREAFAATEVISENHPDDSRCRVELIRIHGALGVMYHRAGQFPQAEKAYKDAASLAEALSAEYPHDPIGPERLALILNNLGTLYSRVHRPREAHQTLEQALKSWEKLATITPLDSDQRAESAKVRVNLGVVDQAEGRLSGAKRLYADAIDVFESLVRDRPLVTDYQTSLATALCALGDIHHAEGEHSLSETVYRKACDHLQALSRESSELFYRQIYARTLNNLGAVLYDTDRYSDADAVFTEAFKIWQDLSNHHSSVDIYVRGLAHSELNLANNASQRNQYQAALSWYDRTIVTWQRVNAFPQPLDRDRFNLRVAMIGRAEIRTELGMYEESLADWESALKLAPKDVEIVLGRARTLALSGDHGESRKAIHQELARSKDMQASQFYTAARAYAIATGKVSDDAKLVDEYATEALKMIERAIAKGFRDVVKFKSEKDFNSLRKRSGFESLVRKLEHLEDGRRRNPWISAVIAMSSISW